MERPEMERTKDVDLNHMQKCRRSTLIVCNGKCLLGAMSQMNPHLHEIFRTIPKFLSLKTLVFDQFVYLGFPEDSAKFEDFVHFKEKEKTDLIADACQKVMRERIEKLRYFNLKYMAGSLWPRGKPLKLVNGNIEIDHERIKRKQDEKNQKKIKDTEQEEIKMLREMPMMNNVGEVKVSVSLKGSQMPLTEFQEHIHQYPSKDLRDYIENLMVHPKKSQDFCDHPQVWGGWAKYHPLTNMRKYSSTIDDRGYSKCCFNFQLKIDICREIDFEFLTNDNAREQLRDTLTNFHEKTVQLFPFYPIEDDFLREKCYKVVVSGPNNHDEVALEKMFTKVPCILGLWSSPYRKKYKPGILIFKHSDRSYVGFIPRHLVPWNRFLRFKNSCDVFYPAVETIYRLLASHDVILDEDQAQEDIWAKYSYPIASNNYMYSVFALAVMDLIERRKQFEEIVQESDLRLKRFEALHQYKHTEDTNELLLKDIENTLIRNSSKHLIGCPHELAWSGRVRFLEFNENDENLKSHYSISAWAYSCKYLTDDLKTELIFTSPEFIKALQIDQLEIMLFSCVGEEMDIIVVPIMTFDFGSIHKEIIDFIADDNNLALSFIPATNRVMDQNRYCPDVYKYLDIKYCVRFQCHNGKVYGQIYGLVDVDRFLARIDDMSPRMIDHVKRNIESNRSSKGFLPQHGKFLWTGEMQFFLNGPQVRGFGSSEHLVNLIRADQLETFKDLDDECIGATRNAPFLAPSGHYVYSTYTAITALNVPTQLEQFFKKGRDATSSLIAFNIDKSVVDNIIGTFKKCVSVEVHPLDCFYLMKELVDLKKHFLAFFLQKNEIMMDLFKISPAEASKRFVILRHNTKDNILAAYYPKEKEKMEQIWKKFIETPLKSSHEKMFKKIKRLDKRESATVNIQTVYTNDGEKSKLETTISCEKRKKSKNKEKEQSSSSSDEREEKVSSLSIDLSQNLKKMFLSDAEKEKPKKVSGKEKVCWNCHATEADDEIKLAKCAGCKKARYCGRECQQEDWERHREYCEKIRQKRLQREVFDLD